MLIYLKTKNTPNGNPRRGWLIVDSNGSVIGWLDEDLLGERGALRQAGLTGEPATVEPIVVTPSEYARLRKVGQEAGA